MQELIGWDGGDEELSGYGEEIVGEEQDDDDIADILGALGYEEDDLGEDDLGYDDEDDPDDLGYDDELGINLRSLMRRLRGRRGRRSRRRAAPRRPRRRSRRVRPRTMGLRKVSNKQLRRYPLGLGMTTLAPGASAIISANPQLPFRVERFITDSTGFFINNIQVGTVSQFVAAGAVQSGVFRPDATGVALRGDTAVPGVQIQVTVTNGNAADAVFGGALIGAVAQ